MKIRNKHFKKVKLFSAVKKTVLCFLIWVSFCSFHPYYVSVTDITYNEQEKTWQVSCRIFTDNLEDALKKIYKQPVDILHPKDKKTVEDLLTDYITKHLKIKLNNKWQVLDFIGYEKEEEAIWCYLEIKNAEPPKNMVIENTLLYDYILQQINMVHTDVKNKKQSSKVDNPEKEMRFDFTNL